MKHLNDSAPPTRRFTSSLLKLATLMLTLVLAAGTRAEEAASRTLASGWEYHQGSLGSAWEVWRGDAASDNVPWAAVTLPHCFNARDAVDPEVRYYQGPGWYRTKLAVANPFPGGRTVLHFDGAGQRTQVFVGFKEVGSHLGGYDEWEVDITDAVAAGNFKEGVPLAVRCDNSRDAETIPSDLSDFNRYGGLYRHVRLEYRPAVAIERVHLEPVLDGAKGQLKVRARLANPGSSKASVSLKVRLSDPKGVVVAEASQELKPWQGEQEIALLKVDSPALWSPAQPQLYRCDVELSSSHGKHTSSQRTGFRSVEWVKHGPFKLNGERLLLKGTHYHEDHAGVAAAVPDDVVRQTLKMMKDMGANFVRLGHYQQAPLVLELCDELGLLVWEEIPWCRGGVGGAGYKQQCRDMLHALIDQHYNHPSVILWGLGNENDWPGDFETFDQEGVRSFMKELNDLCHRLDPSRKTCIRRCDFCKDIVDVYSPSIWAGWYSGRYTEYRAAAEKARDDTDHFFHAEWGGDSHAGRYAEDPEKMVAKVETGKGTAEKGKAYKLTGGKVRMSKDGDWSESYMVNLFDWHLMEQGQMDWLTGSAAWIFKDFATPLRPENPVPRVNQKGVVERDGTPKEGFYVFQSYWATEPMCHLYGKNWALRGGPLGEAKEVRVYSNCPEVELFHNGKSLGTKKRNATSFPACGLTWQVVYAEGDNELRAVAKKGSATVEDSLKQHYQVGESGKSKKMALSEIRREGDLATMEVRFLDEKGLVSLDAADIVKFGITGDAQLLDNLGTRTGSRVVQCANGRAQITVKLTGDKAWISVSTERHRTQFKAIEQADPEEKPAKTSAGTTEPKLRVDVAKIDRERILKAASSALQQEPVTITSFPAKLSEGGLNDFYSNGDYWWPDPTKPNGLPYIRRDGETNPENFSQHRLAVKALRDSVAALAAAYKITQEERYVAKAVKLLQVFFLDEKTRMHPHLNFAQAVPGVSPGRGIGIIDTLHIIEVPVAVKAMEGCAAFPAHMGKDLRKWFADFANWMVTSENGKEEAAAKNNHSVAFYTQLAVFADFTQDQEKLTACRKQYREVFLPNQMAEDGSFPLELARTKPYGYSIFQLDNMTLLCQVLSNLEDNLWSFQLPDGRSIGKAVSYLYPFLKDKKSWPLKPDIQAWDEWPTRQPHLLFAGQMLGEQRYLDLWQKLPTDPADPEVQRNLGLTQPLLWLR
jgi:beta-galactosidase